MSSKGLGYFPAMARPDDRAASTAPGTKPAKPFSCVVCHNRKVKCDRNEPCRNCAKAQIDCIYRAPPPPRRRKRERDATGSASQEREKSLRRMSKGPASDNNAAHITNTALPQSDGVDSKKSGSGRMIMKEGNSVYLDKLVGVLSFALRRKKNMKLMMTAALYGRVLAMRYVIPSRWIDPCLTFCLASRRERCSGRSI